MSPSVSVVIVGYGGDWAWMPRALEALHRNTQEAIEVIVVDNGGASLADRTLPEGKCTVVRNDENIGYAPAVNRGAELIRSETLCLLNADALVEPGWLLPLIEALREDRIGAVFPAKLNVDGTMQEAGAFVTGEALSFVFGDGDDPELLEYRFPREVDFGSGACMVMRREVFAEAGGFDPAYRPIYFEDSDFCFRLRERGLRLVYVPTSRVRHVRTVSISRDETRKAFAANQRRFVDRWRHAIEGRPRLEALQRDPAARLEARDLHARERILVLDGREDESGGGHIRPREAAAMCARSRPSARVTLLAETLDSTIAEDLLAHGVEVCIARAEEWLAERRGHYLAVVGRSDTTDAVRGWIDATQPQAVEWSVEWLMDVTGSGIR